MKAIVNGEAPFKCLKETFAVAATSAGYTLNYSVDKENWSAWAQATPANEVLVVNDVTPFMWFKLVGNADEEVEIIL